MLKILVTSSWLCMIVSCARPPKISFPVISTITVNVTDDAAIEAQYQIKNIKTQLAIIQDGNEYHDSVVQFEYDEFQRVNNDIEMCEEETDPALLRLELQLLKRDWASLQASDETFKKVAII